MEHPQLFARSFAGPSWNTWRAFLAAAFGLPMSEEQTALYQQCTGRKDVPTAAFGESWLICGRRAGKSRIVGLIGVYLATLFCNWRPYLAPGERGTVLVLATDRRQARVIMRYAKGLIDSVPALAAMVTNETTESIELDNGVTIEISTASYRAVRGHTVIAALLDEAAFWRDSETSANPAREVLDALRPAMATIPGAMLLVATSPYARRGIVWESYRRSFGKDDPNVLVWQAATRVMNPGVPQRIIDEAMERDISVATAEYMAEFRSDLEAFLSRDLIDAAITPGCTVRPPQSGVKFSAFADPSGGAGDSFTCGIGHLEGNIAVLDCLYERRPPFNPTEVVAEIAGLLRSYGTTECTGDRYAAGWVVEAFKLAGITYRHSERDRSAIYVDALALFASGRVALLDHPRMANQFAALERRTGAGRDRVDHPPGQHDDLSNAAAGTIINVTAAKPRPIRSVRLDWMST
jgi:hypothetical protein